MIYRTRIFGMRFRRFLPFLTSLFSLAQAWRPGGFAMFEGTRKILGLASIALVIGGEARAQWGYDGWGWWGWDATPESAALHGAGYFAMGAGIYNLKTAQANSIDADTA